MRGATTFDWATLCGESKARTSKTAIKRARRHDTKSFICLDTPKTQRKFSEERACMIGHRRLFGADPDLRAIRPLSSPDRQTAQLTPDHLIRIVLMATQCSF